MPEETRPLLIYDGDCNFCRWWIVRWSHVTGGRVRYAPFQVASATHPQISATSFNASAQLVEVDGAVYQGAEAVFRALAHSPANAWVLWIYRNLPLFAVIAEWVYRFVARHRGSLSRITRLFFDASFQPPSYCLTRRLFSTGLGLTYFFAFASLQLQIHGLIGIHGILPVGEFLQGLREQTGNERYIQFPTVFWFVSGDTALSGACLLGMALGLLAPWQRLPGLVWALLWILYLSIFTVGQGFLSFQWDTLLLEAGFLAIFFAPWEVRPRRRGDPEPSLTALWLYRWLLFRLMFGSGLVKILSGDPSWHTLTALQFHYETQPLPTWIGWYLHQLPAWWHQISTGGVFIVQLLAPFCIFGPRRFRFLAFWAFVLFQLVIEVSGNFGFFNFLTITLCLTLLDDAAILRCVPARWRETWLARRHGQRVEPLLKSAGFFGVAGALLILSLIHLTLLVYPRWNLPPPVRAAVVTTSSWGIVNAYGLFAVMTVERPEIVVEGSDDGETWLAYEFKWKPGDPHRGLAFISPHMPRLDWMMWFAALGNYRQHPWFVSFMERLLTGATEVLPLLQTNPFPQAPPKFIRAVVYDYRFADRATKQSQGIWWNRTAMGLYLPILGLQGGAGRE
jgi:predicted DCC family thiol-disulfide oxidoreductase YuxK